MHNFRHKFKELKLKCLKETSVFMEKAAWSSEVLYDKNTKQRVMIVGFRCNESIESYEYDIQPVFIIGMRSRPINGYSINIKHAGGRFKKIIRC